MSASDDASAIIRRLQPELAKVEGITLYMQPVQDLTVEDRVSRTQFQYSIEDADAQELAQWTPKLVAKLQTLPALRDVATDQLNNGLQDEHHDRPRHGVAAGNFAAGDRQHALRRVRAAAGFDHLHAVEPVSRGPGGAAEFRADSRRAERHLHPAEHGNVPIRARPLRMARR